MQSHDMGETPFVPLCEHMARLTEMGTPSAASCFLCKVKWVCWGSKVLIRYTALLLLRSAEVIEVKFIVPGNGWHATSVLWLLVWAWWAHRLYGQQIYLRKNIGRQLIVNPPKKTGFQSLQCRGG